MNGASFSVSRHERILLVSSVVLVVDKFEFFGFSVLDSKPFLDVRILRLLIFQYLFCICRGADHNAVEQTAHSNEI